MSNWGQAPIARFSRFSFWRSGFFVGMLIDGLLYLIVGFSSGVPKCCHLYVFIYNTVNYFVITADYNTSVFGWKV